MDVGFAVRAWTMGVSMGKNKGVVMQDYLPVIANLIIAAGAIWAARTAAKLGVKGYREQKKQDREEELIKRRQLEYERYLTAFSNAGRWKGVDDEKHAEAEAEYHEAHSNLLLVGSDDAITAANKFHRYYVHAERVDPREVKMRYAAMIVAMRKDGFEETELSVREVAMNIPWTIGNEDVVPIDWTQEH